MSTGTDVTRSEWEEGSGGTLGPHCAGGGPCFHGDTLAYLLAYFPDSKSLGAESKGDMPRGWFVTTQGVTSDALFGSNVDMGMVGVILTQTNICSG